MGMEGCFTRWVDAAPTLKSLSRTSANEREDVLHAGQVPLPLESRHSRALTLKTYSYALSTCIYLIYYME